MSGGRGIVKHLHLAIFFVARAKCGVLETYCSRTAPFSFSNSEPTMFEFSQDVRLVVLVIGGDVLGSSSLSAPTSKG